MTTDHIEKFVNAIACDLEEGGFRQVSGTTLRRSLTEAVGAALPLLADTGIPTSQPAELTEQQGDALLPCPFCGNAAEFVSYKSDGLTLKCTSLGCIQRNQRSLRYGIDSLRDSMTKHWNSRVLAARQPGAQEPYGWLISGHAGGPMFCPASHRHVMEANATDLSKEIGITIVEVYAAPPAQGIDLGPRPMATAPRDGTMVRLLVQFTEHATEDTAEPAWTIGHCSKSHPDDDDNWQFAGWCWAHDHFTEGNGTPVGWLPLIDGQRDAAPGVGNG